MAVPALLARPLQNRVDPFGALHAVIERGMFMGNRGGKIHRPDRTLTSRRWTSRRWIICVCDFKDRHRVVWGDGYTELFFLDEPTALAAGHRPCFECQREKARAFQSAFPGLATQRRRDGRHSPYRAAELVVAKNNGALQSVNFPMAQCSRWKTEPTSCAEAQDCPGALRAMGCRLRWRPRQRLTC